MTHGTAPNLYDRRAERAYAAGLADQQRAQADALRADTMLRLRQAELAQARDEAAEQDRIRRARSYRRQAWRTNLRTSVRDSAVRFAPLIAGGTAMGAPIVLAWSGQLAFGVQVMELGGLAPVVPVALEGAVWYVAYLTHRATQLGLSTSVYRAWAWILAGIAAAMNFWHGATSAGGAQRGAVLALASLLGVGLWELTVRLRERRQRGPAAAGSRVALARRLRYPLLSFQAWSIRTARGPECTAEEAWTAAWERRYGVAPGEARTEQPVRQNVPARTVRLARTFVYAAGPARTAPVRRALVFRTGASASSVRIVRRAFTFHTGARTEQPPATPQPAERAEFVRTITGEILAAAESGDRWGPDYAALMARSLRSKSWCEKRVKEARTAVFA